MANRISKGKKMLNNLRKAKRRLCTLKTRAAILNNKIHSQEKLVDQLVDKIPSADLILYQDELENMTKGKPNSLTKSKR